MILVVGGTGTIGGEVVRLLTARGIAVRALVRDPFAASRIAGRGVELVQGDLSVPGTLAAAFDGVTGVFLATPSGPSTVPLQTNLIRAARDAGVARLVRVSILGIGTGLSARLIGWHAEVEEFLAATGLPAVNLRPTSLMQNLLGSATTIRATGSFSGGQGDGRIAFVDARDVAAAAVGALTREEHRTETVALTGPEALSYADLARVLEEVLERSVSYVDLSAAAFRDALVAAGLPDWLVDDLVAIETASREVVMSVSDGVERLTGRPATPFAAFVRDHRAAFV